MAIRLKPRAEVRDDFIALYRRAAEQKLRLSQMRLSSMSKYMAEATLKRSPAMYGRLGRIIKDVSGLGMDSEVTRLHALDYESFGVYNNLDKGYFFVAKTRPIMMEVIGSTSRRGHYGGTETLKYAYDCGAYFVYVPLSIVENSSLDGIHVIPERAPRVLARHPHHRVRTENAIGNGHPVTWKPSSCWSEFATPMSVAVTECDIPQVFALMRQFVGRFYAGSPLANPEHITEMDFMKKVYL